MWKGKKNQNNHPKGDEMEHIHNILKLEDLKRIQKHDTIK